MADLDEGLSSNKSFDRKIDFCPKILLTLGAKKGRTELVDFLNGLELIDVDSSLEANNFCQNKATAKLCTLVKSSMIQLSRYVCSVSVASLF